MDGSPANSDLHAEITRTRDISDLDCAAYISEARTSWRADLCSFLRIGGENEHGRRDKFCEDIPGTTPREQLSFLGGKPEYLADSANAEAAAPASGDDDRALLGAVKAAVTRNVVENQAATWGILEACRGFPSFDPLPMLVLEQSTRDPRGILKSQDPRNP